MPSVARHALVPFSAAQMFALVADVKSYPEWFDWCLAAEVSSVLPNIEDAELEISLVGLSTRFSTRNVLQPPERIELSLRDGPLRDLQGSWRFKSLANKGCKVSLALSFELSSGILDGLVQIGFLALGDRMLDDFVRVARERYA